MSQKYPGGFITKSPPVPSGPYQDSTARGVWTLDQAMQLKRQGLWPTAGNIAPPSVIGQAYGGGYYAGQIGVSGVATHYLIVGPRSAAQTFTNWKNTQTDTPGTSSVIDGPANTAAMIAAGASAHPAGNFCNSLVTGGFDDWYMPARNELEVCYFNLKPTTGSNNTVSGINPNAVPARASNYTSGDPAQTSAVIFRSSGGQDFSQDFYWSSTQANSAQADRQRFSSYQSGQQGYRYKTTGHYVRAVRRIAV
jgi:hypothetical protein